MRQRAAFALGLALVAPLVVALGCAPKFYAPVSLRFGGLTEADADRVARALDSQKAMFTRSRQSDTVVFTTEDIHTFDKLCKAYKAVDRLRTKEYIQYDFDGVDLHYSSLSASGSAMTTVEVEVSPGALAFVADRVSGDPWRQIRLDNRGRWRGNVQTAGRVSNQGGWLYVAFTRDARLYRFIRVNVLTGAQESTTLSTAKRAGLGEPSARSARSDGGAPSTSGSIYATPEPRTEPAKSTTSGSSGSKRFKWPWEK